jgi:hypothetical protein
MIAAARWISLVAAFFWGAVAEYHLGTAVGADKITAALLPLVVDVYGFAAMKTGRTPHVVGALAAMFGTQMAAHLLAMGAATKGMTALSIAVSALPPAVSLACHRLGGHAPAVDAEPVTVTAECVTVDTPVEPVTVPAVTAILDAVDTVDTPAAPVVPPAAPRVAPVVETAGEMTKREYAVKGAELIAQGFTKTDAAAELKISRQWLHRCMTTEGVTV